MCGKSKSKSQVYVKDLRRVLMCNQRRCRFPKKYDEIVRSGNIITQTDSDGNIVSLKLLYGKKSKNGTQPSFGLSIVSEDVCHSKAYYCIDLLADTPAEELSESCFEPFGFSRSDVKKYVPVIDIQKTDDFDEPFKLVYSFYLPKKNCSVNPETEEVDPSDRNEKGRNGKLLYSAEYKKLDTTFFVIRDENDKLELDKTIIICIPFTLSASIVKFFGKLLTFLPMKLGEYLLSKKNPVAKFFGHIFFTPFMPLKFIIDLGAILIKLPVTLFVADEKKYGTSYWSLWKYELIECWHELKSDCSVIKNGKRPQTVDYPEYHLIGTWDELNVRYEHVERALENEV